MWRAICDEHEVRSRPSEIGQTMLDPVHDVALDRAGAARELERILLDNPEICDFLDGFAADRVGTSPSRGVVTGRDRGPPASEFDGGEASRALRLAIRLSDQGDLSAHLATSTASCSVIDQAIGIIMVQNRCTATEGFEILRLSSDHHDIELGDLASEVVTRVAAESAEMPRDAPDGNVHLLSRHGQDRSC